MLDIKFVRSNPEAVVAGMKKRGMDLDLAPFLALDEKRRALLTEVEQLKNNIDVYSQDVMILSMGSDHCPVTLELNI
mgnify:CR=1 FL=1